MAKENGYLFPKMKMRMSMMTTTMITMMTTMNTKMMKNLPGVPSVETTLFKQWRYLVLSISRSIP